MDMIIKTQATLELPKELQENLKQALAIVEELYYARTETFQIFNAECKKIAKNRNCLENYDMKKTIDTLHTLINFANIDMSDFDEDKYLHDLFIE